MSLLNFGCMYMYVGKSHQPLIILAHSKLRILSMLPNLSTNRQSCKMTLNDHGLFKLNVSDHHQYYRMNRDGKRHSRGERINCKTEKDIFDALGLEFRTPPERRDFDDVVELGSAKPISLDVSEKDFAEESRQQWVQ